MAAVKTYSYYHRTEQHTTPRPVPSPRSKNVEIYSRQSTAHAPGVSPAATRQLDDLSGATRQRVVLETMSALERDVQETANYLRRASTPREDPPELSDDEARDLLRTYESWTTTRPVSAPPRPQESPPAKKRVTPPLAGAVRVYPESPPVDYYSRTRPTKSPVSEVTEDSLLRDFGLDWDDRSRSREQRPMSQSLTDVSAPHRRVPRDRDQPLARVCAFCGKGIEGSCITALAANSDRAQRFHPNCFMCIYCLRPLNRRGTYKEHERRPYCHECSYRLFSGPIM